MKRSRFEIEQFEYLKATDEAALLRLAGRWRGEVPDECVLTAVAGNGATRLDPLPHPPSAEDGIWRAAYSAPLALVEGRGARFALETGHGRVKLPRPGERGAAKAATKRSAEPRRGLLARRRDAKVKALSERSREAERALSHERTARVTAERMLERERARYEAAAAEVRDGIARASVERGRFLQWIEEGAAERARLEHEVSELRREVDEAHHAAAEAGRVEQQARVELERVRVESSTAADSARQAEHQARLELARAQADAEDARSVAEDRAKALRKADRRLAGMRKRLEQETRRRNLVEADLRRAQGRQQVLIRDLDSAQAESRKLRTRVTELESALAMLRTGYEQSEHKLAVAESEAEELRARLAEVAFQHPADGPDPATLASLREELERRAGRLEQLERQADALRRAILARMAARAEDVEERELAAAT